MPTASKYQSWKSLNDETLMSVIDLVNKQEKAQQEEAYMKFKDLFDDVKNFIIDKRLVLYGGTALNEILPEKYKFYPKQLLPDYDFFSHNAKSHAQELADILNKKGYNYIEVKPGLHHGTYKVYAEFLPVADITQIDKDIYENLVDHSDMNLKNEQSDFQLIVSPYPFLKWSLYLELSKIGSTHRWQKLFPRYVAVNHVYKFDQPRESKHPLKMDSPLLNTVTSLFKTFIKTKKYPVVGSFGMNLHMGLPYKDEYNPFTAFEIMTTDLNKTLEELKITYKVIKGIQLYLVWPKKPFSTFMANRCTVMAKIKGEGEIGLCKLYEVTDVCYCVKHIKGFVVGTVDAILQYMYASYMKSEILQTDYSKEKLLYLSKEILILETFIDTKIKHKSKRLSLECYGKEKSLLDIRKEQWGQKQFFYRPKAKSTKK